MYSEKAKQVCQSIGMICKMLKIRHKELAFKAGLSETLMNSIVTRKATQIKTLCKIEAALTKLARERWRSLSEGQQAFIASILDMPKRPNPRPKAMTREDMWIEPKSVAWREARKLEPRAAQ